MLPMYPARNLQKQIDKGFAGRSYQILNKYGSSSRFAYNKKDESSNYLKVISMKVSKWN